MTKPAAIPRRVEASEGPRPFMKNCVYCVKKKIKCSGKVQGGKCGRCQRDGVECTFRAKMKPGPRQGQARKNGRDAEPPRKKKGARRRKRGANPAETAPTKEDDGGGSGGGNPQKKKRKTMAEQHELPPTPGHEGGKKSRSAPIPPLGSLAVSADDAADILALTLPSPSKKRTSRDDWAGVASVCLGTSSQEDLVELAFDEIVF